MSTFNILALASGKADYNTQHCAQRIRLHSPTITYSFVIHDLTFKFVINVQRIIHDIIHG